MEMYDSLSIWEIIQGLSCKTKAVLQIVSMNFSVARNLFWKSFWRILVYIENNGNGLENTNTKQGIFLSLRCEYIEESQTQW